MAITVTGTTDCSAATAAKRAGLRSVVGSTWMRWGKGLSAGDKDGTEARARAIEPGLGVELGFGAETRA